MTALFSLVLLAASAAPSTPVPLKPKTVVAAKGPFKLTFEVANTEVREGDSLWVRLTLTNTSNRPRKVSYGWIRDVLFLVGGPGVFIEVREMKSKALQSRDVREDIVFTEAIEACLDRYEKEHPEPPLPKSLTLGPGESVSTPSKPPVGAYALRHCERDPAPVLMHPYGEIPDWEWTANEYEVRAVYDRRLSPDLKKHLTEEGRQNRDALIRFQTPWVTLRRVAR